MKKNIIVSILSVWIFLFTTDRSWATLNVVTTTPDLASIANEIGGNLIQADSLVKGYQDAHFMQPKPSYLVKMNRADLLIYQGLELEIGWLPVLINGARNPDIKPGQPGHLNASAKIAALEIPIGEVDRSMGDVHPYGNPHYNLDPENGFILARVIGEKLSELDPKNASQYERNLDRFNKKLEEKLIQWKNQMSPFQGKEIVTYHRHWSYFAKRFGLSVISTIELKPGVSPSVKHLSAVTETIIRQKIKLILRANYIDSKFSNIVAEKIGATVLPLPVFVGGIPEANDYFSLFDTIIEKIIPVLQSNS
jgi:zinc/manganese transport system substrate-binding protein